MAEGAIPRGAEGPLPSMRLDRFLWFARLAPTRSAAQGIVADGRLRLDGRPVDRAHVAVRVGNILTFAAFGRVRVVRVAALPPRRGPAPEAQACYAELQEPVAIEPRPSPALPRANVSHQAPQD